MATITQFIEACGKERTRSMYRTGITRFLEWKFKEKDIGLRFEELGTLYLSNGNHYGQDLVAFANYLRDHYAPISRRVYLAAVKQWFLFNDIEISRGHEKQIRQKNKGARARTEDEPFTLDIIRQIVDNGNLRLRAIVLILLSSGMRLHEVLQLIPRDINFNASPVTIRLPDTYTKNGRARTVYISGEAVIALKEWMERRSDYLKYREMVSHNLKKTGKTEDRIFPMRIENVIGMFNQALIRSGRYALDKDGEKITIRDRSTGRTKVHLHGLRKYFRTALAKAEAEGAIDITEHLMGHIGYLGGVYTERQIPEEDIRAFYLENEHRLMIHPPALTERDRESMKAMTNTNTQLQEKVATLEAQLQILTKLIQAPSVKA